MRLILKLFAVPFALALMMAALLFSFVLSVSGAVFGIASTAVFALSMVLFITGQTTGGIAWLAIAFLISPFGIPAFAEWFVRKIDNAGYALKAFILS